MGSPLPFEVLRKALTDPAAAALPDLPLDAWDLMIRQARRAGLLARLAWKIEQQGLSDGVPACVRPHLEAERTLAAKHARDVRWEVRCIQAALAPLDIPVILLKGAAYLIAGLPAANGRVFGDVDILVPKPRLADVESALYEAGWRLIDKDSYDLDYYRRWMHQLPPLQHEGRRTVIDVHHTILPETARVELPAEALVDAALPVAAGQERLRVLAPPDMVLHSATHLFREGEFPRGLRDLHDLDALLRHFPAADPDFWPSLLRRGRALDLGRPLFYALRHAVRLFATPVPAEILDGAARFAPPPPVLRLMDALLAQALRPPHASCRDPATPAALWLLYVRAHHLRMPPHLLLPHLARKALRRPED